MNLYPIKIFPKSFIKAASGGKIVRSELMTGETPNDF
jgi:hypothetical protein